MNAPPRKSRGTPMLVGAGGMPLLEPIKLGKGQHDEAWLQKLIFDHPGLLPIADIEPGFGEPIPVAREVPCGHGYIDNLYVTPAGEIILVEAKLWNNVEARRKVVAQALDYVAALSGLDYSGFEAIVLKGDTGSSKPASLYSIVADHPDALSEPDFIDAVARNLARRRLLVLVLGDGIRAEAEALVGVLQGHPGAHFTFALVELATWRHAATGEILVVPNTLAQTVMIERGILAIVDGQAVIKDMPRQQMANARPQSLSEELFYEQIARRDPKLPDALQAFLRAVEPLGVRTTLGLSLQLWFESDRPKPVKLGYVGKNGQLWTENVLPSAPQGPALAYLERVAKMIGGVPSPTNTRHVTVNGTSAPYLDQLLPAHAAEWAQVIEAFIQATRAEDAERP